MSTPNDVLLLLGEPRGYGEARLDQNFPHQRVWYYEHIVTEGSKIKTSMLLVFFTDDRYDGYMWFADAIQSKSQNASDRR